MGDLPFGCYESSPLDAVKNAVRIMKEGHMDAVKLEGMFAHLSQLPLTELVLVKTYQRAWVKPYALLLVLSTYVLSVHASCHPCR